MVAASLKREERPIFPSFPLPLSPAPPLSIATVAEGTVTGTEERTGDFTAECRTFNGNATEDKVSAW